MNRRSVAPQALRDLLLGGGELALLDVREQGVFGRCHILLANNLPLNHLELKARDLLPRPGVPVVLCDGGEGLADRAAARLTDMGFTDIAILDGGVDAWAAAGFEVFSGVNVPSKAFGEYVEHRFDTPRIAAADLKAEIDAGTDLVILDSRPMDEYRVMNIPGGIDTPGAELVQRVRDLAPDPETFVVVNCAGRTRSIIGCQSLVNAGIPNRVAALKNGTMGWHLAGFALERGATRRYGPVSPDGDAWSRDAAARVAERFGVRRIDRARLAAWQAEADRRSLYVLDVRAPEDYAAGHLPGSIPAPGGQLVQATDQWIAVRNARVVLVDDSGVRATMTASWLIQMGLPEVYVLDGGLGADDLETGSYWPNCPELDATRAETITAEELYDERGTSMIIDVGPSLAHRAGHIPGACWAIRARLDDAIETPAATLQVVISSDDGRLARLAADDLRGRLYEPVLALEGGTAAWRAAGLPLTPGMERALHAEDDVYHRPYDREAGVEAAMNAYLDWEVALVEQLERDGTLRFPDFPA